MPKFSERRKYQRSSSLLCKVLVSNDRRRWDQVFMHDISATGMSFRTKVQYRSGDVIFLNIDVYSMLSEFCISVEGSIVRVSETSSGFLCGVTFNRLSKAQQIQIDELINRNNSGILGEMRTVLESEEEYTNGLKTQNRQR